jgi:hypothetical protein
MGGAMGWEEKRAWIALVVAIVTFSGYCFIILIKADGGPLDEVANRLTFLWAIGVSIVASIVIGSAGGWVVAEGRAAFR